MVKQGRVITTDFNLVKVIPIANEADELALPCAAIDSDGILYVWGNLVHFLPNERHIITQCWDDNVSDADFISITEKMFE